MKKLLALLLALMMLFTLTACGSVNNGTQGGTQGSVTSEDVDSMISGIGLSNKLYSDMDPETKQAFIAEGARQGLDISFGADGSTTIVDTTDGTIVTQNPDGTWVFKEADGSEGQIGGNWPDNEYTRLVPKPNLELQAAYNDGESFGVTFVNATVEQIKAYVAQVKAAGFNINEVVEDEEFMGMVIYSFTAENAEGYTVEIAFADGISTLTISK